MDGLWDPWSCGICLGQLIKIIQLMVDPDGYSFQTRWAPPGSPPLFTISGISSSWILSGCLIFSLGKTPPSSSCNYKDSNPMALELQILPHGHHHFPSVALHTAVWCASPCPLPSDWRFPSWPSKLPLLSVTSCPKLASSTLSLLPTFSFVFIPTNGYETSVASAVFPWETLFNIAGPSEPRNYQFFFKDAFWFFK